MRHAKTVFGFPARIAALLLALILTALAGCASVPQPTESSLTEQPAASDPVSGESPQESGEQPSDPQVSGEESAPAESSGKTEDGQSETPSEAASDEPSESPSEAQSDEPSEEPSEPDASSEDPVENSETSEEPMIKTWPCLSGTFLQPWAFTAMSDERWEAHLGYLLEAGIDTVIVQWVAETPYGKLSSLYYPSKLSIEKAAGYAEANRLLPGLLKAAEKTGVKVFVGLNLSDEWWNFACTKDDWNKMQSGLGIDMAKEIYELYKKEYPNALHGWYFAWEMFNGMIGYETKAADFLNMYLDPLNELDPSMPMMLSPFVRASGGNAAAAGREWTKVFSLTHFRKGDIFCCQDAVGAGHITIGQLDGYFAALKEAADTKDGLLFWANNENFTKDYQPRPVKEFLEQMKIAQPYVSGFVTFAYSHYYSPDVPGKAFNRTYHDAYVKYYNTGSPD